MKNSIPYKPLSLPLKDYNLIDNELLNLLAKASDSLGCYKGMIDKVKIDYSFITISLLISESYYSTKIEGTQTTLEDVYKAENDLENSKQTKDQKEVLNYMKAMKRGEYLIKDRKDPISSRLFKDLHKILLEDIDRKNSAIIGEYRQQQVYVGAHTPPISSEIDMYIGNLENYINSEDVDDLPHIIKIAIIHAQFETIHPFYDGNGRMGRILIPLYLFSKGLISEPYFFISKSLEKEKHRYYQYLQGTRNGKEESYKIWIKFFLNAVIKQVETEKTIITNVESYYKECKDKIMNKSNSQNMLILLDTIFKKLIFNTKIISKETGLNISTIRAGIKKFVELDIITPDDKKRNTSYYCYDLMDLLS